MISFFITLFLVDWWIGIGKRLGFMSKDMNKPGDVYAVESGGVWVAVGASFGILFLVAMYRYVGGSNYYIVELMALTTMLFMASFLGFLDDILGWKKGLRVWQRVLFAAPLALPLMVIKAGVSTMALPIIGVVNLGIIYPLVLVPIGVLGAANAFNMIAGYNGLEAGMGIILMGFIAIYSYIKGIYYITYTSIIMAAALLAFLYYNWLPAKVFPGNSLTYGVGAYYASLVILGNFERFGLILFTLYFIELLLFIRGLLNGVYKENYGIPNEKGELQPPYNKAYSVTHLTIILIKKIKGQATERDVVLTIMGIQVLIGLITLYTALYKII